jgi:D-aminopeptidase
MKYAGQMLSSMVALFLISGTTAAQNRSAVISDPVNASARAQGRVLARELGIKPGVLTPGKYNAITDVPGVLVGQVTIIEGKNIRTGATAIIPHPGNIFQNKVPAGLAVENGYGKLAGATQIMELGEIETPIVLTNTLSVPRATEALVRWTLRQPGNEMVRSVNGVAGETNDGRLNDIRALRVTVDDVLAAVQNAKSGPVAQGTVGAGTGTMAFDWKGGIGTSSRVLPAALGGYTVGVIVQSNYGGILQMDGAPIGEELGQYYLKDYVEPADREDGSIMIIVATNAPLSDRNLTRLARRTFTGLALTGSSMSAGSGDYAIAFSTAEEVRRTTQRRTEQAQVSEVPNDNITPLFVAAIEATEEAIYNSMLMATTVESLDWATGKPRTAKALDIGKIKEVLSRYRPRADRTRRKGG